MVSSLMESAKILVFISNIQVIVPYKNICIGNGLEKYDGHGYKTVYNMLRYTALV